VIGFGYCCEVFQQKNLLKNGLLNTTICCGCGCDVVHFLCKLFQKK
jgi:hypothetical protein